MKKLSNALVGTVAAGAMALSAATPAAARDNRGDIGAGEVIAGALIIGGIAAVAAASSKDRNDYGYGRGRDYGYDRAGYRRIGRDNPRGAVEQCVRAAERDAGRYSHGGADVTDVRSVRETRSGYEVRGRIAVNSMGRGWRKGDSNYGRGWNGDYRGWNSSMRGYDSGTFRCKVEFGRIAKLDYNGIRGL